jgi:hypothetical protein
MNSTIFVLNKNQTFKNFDPLLEAYGWPSISTYLLYLLSAPAALLGLLFNTITFLVLKKIK